MANHVTLLYIILSKSKTCVFFKFGFGEGRRLQPGSCVALICDSGRMTKLTSRFALTPLNGKPATEMLLHDARISQSGLTDVDKIRMTTPNSNSDVIISISTCHNMYLV
jgi:hypothetical protein